MFDRHCRVGILSSARQTVRGPVPLAVRGRGGVVGKPTLPKLIGIRNVAPCGVSARAQLMTITPPGFACQTIVSSSVAAYSAGCSKQREWVGEMQQPRLCGQVVG